MKTLLVIGTILATLLCGHPAIAQNNQVNIVIHLSATGLPSALTLGQLEPAIDPKHILPGQETPPKFDVGQSVWLIETKPLEEFITPFRIQLLGPEPERNLHPPLALEVPFRPFDLPIVIPVRGELNAELLDRYYEGTAGLDTWKDWLRVFVIAEQAVLAFRGQSSVDETPLGVAIARALVLYATALDKLVSTTEWFGRPQSMKDNQRLIGRLLEESSDELRRHIGPDRLKHAKAAIVRTEHYIYKRIVKYSISYSGNDDLFCNHQYNHARKIYDKLRRMPEDQYKSLAEALKYPMAQESLLVTVRCFRQLLSREGNTLFAQPAVIEEQFEGKDPLTVLKNLRTKLRHEIALWNRNARNNNATVSEICGRRGRAVDQMSRRLCNDLKYLADVEPLIVAERSDRSN